MTINRQHVYLGEYESPESHELSKQELHVSSRADRVHDRQQVANVRIHYWDTCPRLFTPRPPPDFANAIASGLAATVVTGRATNTVLATTGTIYRVAAARCRIARSATAATIATRANREAWDQFASIYRMVIYRSSRRRGL